MDIKNLSIEELKNCIISRKIILSNGEERKFDLIDFYLMSEKKPKSFLRIIKPTTDHSEFVRIKKFFERFFVKRQGSLKFIAIDDLLKIRYNYKNYELCEQEKEKIVSFLINNNIPINEATYFCAAKKYIDGDIDINRSYKDEIIEPKKKTRIKKNVKSI